VTGYFATTMPGLGELLGMELARRPGLEPTGQRGNDGRSDIVFFRIRRGSRLDLDQLRLAEDVFVTVAEASSAPPVRLAAALVSPAALERALSTWARVVRHLTPAMTFRVIARVVDERRFRRTELRGAVLNAVAGSRTRWRLADPAELEVWALEYAKGRFVAGLRLSDTRMRQHGPGRAVERRGALRPVVAAAMVQLAGQPPGRLLDPCCGSGTLLGEALARTWTAIGADLDPAAVATARANVPLATVEQGDVLRLPHPDGSMDAVATNLPFGRQFKVQADDPRRWVTSALRELARVTRPGGRVVVLVPPPLPASPEGLTLSSVHPLRLLGTPTRIWAFDRAR
jgi:23S rRNA G2445 N2-methylase RlmL